MCVRVECNLMVKIPPRSTTWEIWNLGRIWKSTEKDQFVAWSSPRRCHEEEQQDSCRLRIQQFIAIHSYSIAMYCKTAFVSAMNMFIWWSPHFVGPLEVFLQRKSSSTISRAASVWRFDNNMIDSKFTYNTVRNFSFQGRRLTYTFDLFHHARHRFFLVGSCDVCLLTRYELEGGRTSIVAQDDHGRLIHGRRHSKEERYASKNTRRWTYQVSEYGPKFAVHT